MATIRQFEDIEAWKIARVLYQETLKWTQYPILRHRYRFIDQVTSSAGSVMDNIAEGFERGSTREFIQFLSYANGSNAEFRSQLYQAFDAGALTAPEFERLNNQALFVSGKIRNLIKYLRNTDLKGARYVQSGPEPDHPSSRTDHQNHPRNPKSD